MKFDLIAVFFLLPWTTQSDVVVASTDSPGLYPNPLQKHRRRKPLPREKKAYDTSVRSFSPDGSIYQIEYAAKAAEQGGLVIGVQTDEGVVLAADTREQSPLLKRSSVSKINDIDSQTSCAMSGLLPDGRFMVDHARSWSQEHWFEFEEPPSVEGLAAQLSRLALRFNGYDKGTEEGGTDEGDKEIAMSRPVGVALLLAGSDSRGPVLYHLDPSGTYLQWRAKAIGKQSDDAEAKLEKVEYKDLSLRDAMALVLEVFEAVLQDDFSTDRVEMSCLDCSSDASAVVSKDDMKTIGAGVGEGVGVGLEHTPFFRRVSKAAMDAIVQDAQKRLSKSNECGEGGGQGKCVPSDIDSLSAGGRSEG